MQIGFITGPLTVQLPYALQQQIQMIIKEIWRSGKMTWFVAGIGLRMPSRTSRIWPLEIYHLVSLFPCCPYHAKYSIGSSQASNHLDILGHSASQTAISLLQLQPRLLTTGPYCPPVYAASSEIAHRNHFTNIVQVLEVQLQYSTCPLIAYAKSSVRHRQLKSFSETTYLTWRTYVPAVARFWR